MRFKNTYILAALAIAFAGYIYFFEIKKADVESKLKEQSEKILVFEPEKVQKVILYNSFGIFALEKDSENVWRIVSPIKDLADDSTVQSILTTISNEKYDQIVSEAVTPDDLKSYGLDEPKLKIELYFSSGETKALVVGSDAAIAGKLYLQKAGDKQVLFANQNIKYQIEKNPRELRDKKIFKKPREQLSSVVIKSSQGTTVLVQKDKNWWVEKPFKGLADPNTVLTFFNALESMRATDFSTEKSFSDKPIVQIEFFDRPGHLYDVLSLSPSKQSNSYIKLKNSKNIFQVFSNTTEGLVKKPDDFKDRKSFFEFARPAVDKISIRTDLVKYDFLKKNENWEMDPPNKKKQANVEQIVILLNKMMEAAVSEFTDAKSIGKTKGQIIFKNAQDEVLLNFQWGDKSVSGKSVLVKTQKTTKPVGVYLELISSLPGQTLVEDKK